MIKGIYNENEFYTNHYWSSKFFDDLASKTQTISDLKFRANTIKELGEKYWDLIESKNASDENHTEQFIEFYQALLKGLGYSFAPKKRQTVEGLYYSVATEVKLANKSHLLIGLTKTNESGSFESLPLELLALNQADEEVSEDRDLAEITSEELDSETGPKWFIVGALDNLHLIQRGKWSYGRFIRVNLSEIFAQKDEKAYTMLLGLFSSDILAPESGLSIHEELDDNSHRHAFAVTTELREGVRESIELLINEMIYAKKEAHQEYLKKDKDADEYAKELTHDALFYVYRLIFLLFLESQGDDSELLPLKSEIYRHGYSLEKLLEIAFKQIHEGTQEYEGTFIQESLERIFDLIFNGFIPQRSGDFLTENLSTTGFLVKGLKSDLFDPAKVKHLKSVSLRNGVLQRMLQKLSMADIKEGKKTRKARVSYANLGINQLGAVYEGLLSYTGFFAKEDLYELTQVKKGKDDDEDSADNDEESLTKATKVDPDKIYLAPKSLVEKYKKDKKYKLTNKHFVLDKETGEPVRYKRGSFIFRMAGRDRQKLASFYTPESLTKCTVKYALKVLFENKKSIEELRKVKILEPAMGSGAFLNEAVNQLADKIIELEVKGNPSTLKTPKDRQKRLAEIKYELISSNVYGVDLNPTAIELARFSLWLNCISAGKEPPNFDGKLKVGNSLIGARFKKNADGVYPWLMLDRGMMDYGKKLSDYDKNSYEKIKKFRDSFLNSELSATDILINEVQLKAEQTFKNLTAGKNTDKNYSLLKLCCDLWSSLFFLNSEAIKFYPKSHKEFLEIILKILSESFSTELKNLQVSVNQIVTHERFFHWELEFPFEITSGGFDLIMGNPPWVAVEWQDALYVSDYNIMPLVHKMNAAGTRKFVEDLNESEINFGLGQQFIRVLGYSKMLETPFYKDLEGVQKNTYKTFDVLCFNLLSKDGSFGIIQEDGILEDKAGAEFREKVYRRYQYHFQFQNEKKLFAEIGNAKRFSVNIFGAMRDTPNFIHIGNCFLPSTIDDCFISTGDGDVPLVKDSSGSWDVRGHKERIIKIDQKHLNIFGHFLNDEANESPQFLNLHSESLLKVIEKIASCSNTFESYAGGAESCLGSAMFDESGAQDKGYIKPKSNTPNAITQVVLSGPHINTGNPLSQETKKEYKSKFSYDKIDLSKVDDKFIPRTLYQLNLNPQEADEIFPTLNGKPFRSYFRLITRGMVNATNERCMFTCIVPPGVSYINGIKGLCIANQDRLPLMAGIGMSLIADAIFRLKNKSNVFPEDIKSLPIGTNIQFLNSIARRALALNGLTTYYSELWKMCSKLDENDSLIGGKRLNGFGEHYVRKNTLRSSDERNAAMIEIDALTALNYGLSSEELVQLYQILFPVLSMYDRKNNFDRKSKLKEAYNFFDKRGY